MSSSETTGWQPIELTFADARPGEAVQVEIEAVGTTTGSLQVFFFDTMQLEATCP